MRVPAFALLCLAACASFGTGEEPTSPVEPDPSAPPDASLEVDAGVSPPGQLAACGWRGFSDDFARAAGEDILGRWEVGHRAGTGIVMTGAGAPDPRGQSLQVDIEPSGANRFYELRHTLAASGERAPTCVELAFAVYQASGGPAFEPMILAALELSNGAALTLWMANERLVFAEQDGETGDPWYEVGAHEISTGRWHEVVMRYAHEGASAPSLSVSVDEETVETPIGRLASGPADHVTFGAGFTRASVSARYWLDDVVIR